MDVQKNIKRFSRFRLYLQTDCSCCNEAYPKAGMIMTAGKNVSVPGEAIWPGTG